MIRAFIAILLPEPLLEQLARIQQMLERQIPPGSVRWVKPEGIHLTLKFLGDTPEERIPTIRAALSAVARAAVPCTFTVGDLGCFPSLRRPRVLWVGVQEPLGRLTALQAAVERAMASLGYPPEGRGFSPHLTLGRVKDSASPRDVARVGEVVASGSVGTLGEVQAESFALIQSILRPTGAEYVPLAEFRLGPA
ncbi:MAG: RNA 2',3'-cyclic phosphodiesterase [Anaerolineae bacterium]|nr:RNA 2',3'-cyclic phosphodiesterase [Anaerolineae bacterium]MDW8069318.1 RNA 2',3'-cyclic phosphodiesterase [Anaerolineae bacterium]